MTVAERDAGVMSPQPTRSPNELWMTMARPITGMSSPEREKPWAAAEMVATPLPSAVRTKHRRPCIQGALCVVMATNRGGDIACVPRMHMPPAARACIEAGDLPANGQHIRIRYVLDDERAFDEVRLVGVLRDHSNSHLLAIAVCRRRRCDGVADDATRRTRRIRSSWIVNDDGAAYDRLKAV